MSEMRCTLSICIPTFNRGPVLAARIRSWLKDAPNDCEIVVSDNASSMGWEALAAIQDERFVFLRNSENVGSLENQLRAFEAARGKYVMQLTDKDELVTAYIHKAVEVLREQSVACGGFRLSYGTTERVYVREYGGLLGFSRFGFRYSHPSGRFFRRDVLTSCGILKRIRAKATTIGAIGTDWLTSLCLREGHYLDVGCPFVVKHQPPYEGLEKSSTYRDVRTCWFTPDAAWRGFAEYVELLRGLFQSGVERMERLLLIGLLVRRSLFPQMTRFYRGYLSDEATCQWYGIPHAWVVSELSRDLESDFFQRVWHMAEFLPFENMAVRLAAWTCWRRARRQKRKLDCGIICPNKGTSCEALGRTGRFAIGGIGTRSSGAVERTDQR